MKEAVFALAAWGRLRRHVPMRIMMRKLRMRVLSGVKKRRMKCLKRSRPISNLLP
jgi:hypothetical protein